MARYRAAATNFLDFDIRDSGHQTLQNFEIIVASNCLTRWSKFFMDNSFAIEEYNEH